jgi:hypothetical protein
MRGAGDVTSKGLKVAKKKMGVSARAPAAAAARPRQLVCLGRPGGSFSLERSSPDLARGAL